MSFTVIIPARYASTRLPAKPLADIGGVPMVIRVMQRASQSGAGRVCVATDDIRVFELVREHGGEVLMTRADHVSGSDRLEEVARQLELPAEHIIVNVQGDEPLIPPAVIDQVAANLAGHADYGMATLCEPIESRAELFNPDIVKVVADERGRALYFSRAPIPWHRDGIAEQSEDLPLGQWWRHIGIYAYRAGFLHRFVGWPPARIELTESLEQLRAMANGIAIHVAPAAEPVPGGVDTPEDLARMRALFG